MNKGFTLVELLVSISILAILTLITLMAFSSVQKNSRDGKRKSDLSVIQSALEQYHADQGYYPTADIVSALLVSGNALTSPSGNKTYVSKISKDPLNTEPNVYYYTATPSCDNTTGKFCTGYCLYAKMENNSNVKDISSCSNQVNPGQEKNYEVAPN